VPMGSSGSLKGVDCNILYRRVRGWIVISISAGKGVVDGLTKSAGCQLVIRVLGRQAQK